MVKKNPSKRMLFGSPMGWKVVTYIHKTNYCICVETFFRSRELFTESISFQIQSAWHHQIPATLGRSRTTSSIRVVTYIFSRQIIRVENFMALGVVPALLPFQWYAFPVSRNH
jgi:hypothetical protein